MKMLRTPVALVVLTALVAFAAAGCKKEAPAAGEQVDLSKPQDLFSQPVVAPQPPVDPAKVVAVVEGTEITQGQVNDEMTKLMSVASRRLPPERLAQMQGRLSEQARENLILKTLLAKAVDDESVKVTDEEITNAIAKIVASLPPGANLSDIVAQNNWTQEQFNDNLVQDLKINKLLEEHTQSAGEPTDDEVKAFYEENKARFDVPESATARHILIATELNDTPEAKAAKKEKAEKLQKELVGGADFAKLAEENSDCPSKSRGGDLGTFTRGQMVKPFEDAAFSQKINEIGPVIETQFGYHILQVTDRKDARTLPLEEVKERLAQALKSQKQQEAAKVYLEELKAKAKIEYPEGAPAPAMAPSMAPAEVQAPPAPAAELSPAPAPEAAPAPAAEPVP